MEAELGEEVRRSDGELLGYVRQRSGGSVWSALAAFGAEIGRADTREAAIELVLRDGLGSLAQRWFHRSAADGVWRVVILTETWPGRARGVVGLYALPDAPTFEISAADLAAGDEMTLVLPGEADLDLTLSG